MNPTNSSIFFWVGFFDSSFIYRFITSSVRAWRIARCVQYEINIIVEQSFFYSRGQCSQRGRTVERGIEKDPNKSIRHSVQLSPSTWFTGLQTPRIYVKRPITRVGRPLNTTKTLRRPIPIYTLKYCLPKKLTVGWLGAVINKTVPFGVMIIHKPMLKYGYFLTQFGMDRGNHWSIFLKKGRRPKCYSQWEIL